MFLYSAFAKGDLRTAEKVYLDSKIVGEILTIGFDGTATYFFALVKSKAEEAKANCYVLSKGGQKAFLTSVKEGE